jgi:hypothetical protein
MVCKGTNQRRLRLLSIAVLSLCSATLHGADGREADWSNLAQLRGGQEIQVVQKNLKSQEGEFLRFSEETISFRVRNDDVSVPREEVLRITLRAGHKRLRGALLGMLAGGGIGLAVGAAQDSKYNCSDPSSDYCYHKLAGSVIGLGIGAAAGAAVPPRYPTIYRATPPKRD